MVDLLGPGDAGAVNYLTTTADVTSPVTGDTWSQDCIGGASGTGTDITAKDLNRSLQQLRVAIRAGGVPQSNAYDAMLAWAIQSGYDNFIGIAGGSANALTGSVPSSPISVPDGTVYRGVASTPNTGASTYNHQGLGALPILSLEGDALTGGEIDGVFELMKYGSNWYLLSGGDSGNPFQTTGVGAVVIVQSTASASPFSLVGQTGTWSGSAPSNFSLGGGGIGMIDARWAGIGAPAGTWQIQTISKDQSAGGYGTTLSTYPENMTLVRIA